MITSAELTGAGSSVRPRRRWLRPGSPGQELAMTLLLGAAGTGLIFLATRQGWAVVATNPPRPLPASRVHVTGAALVPYADALVVAGLATLAAVLATRGLVRRLTGVLLAVIGAGLTAAAFTASKSGAIAAASATANPATATAGSVTDGSTPATSAAPDVAGITPHVTIAATFWQVLVVAGAAAMVAAGILILLRARRMAVMSSRYDSPTGASRGAPSARQRAGSAAATGPAASTGAPGTATASTVTSSTGPSDSASLWEALSRGEDPT